MFLCLLFILYYEIGTVLLQINLQMNFSENTYKYSFATFWTCAKLHKVTHQYYVLDSFVHVSRAQSIY